MLLKKIKLIKQTNGYIGYFFSVIIGIIIYLTTSLSGRTPHLVSITVSSLVHRPFIVWSNRRTL